MATVMSGETAAATERWFRRRGVPHFTRDYNAREDILTRARQALAVRALYLSAIEQGEAAGAAAEAG